jgi:hypothetical protein
MVANPNYLSLLAQVVTCIREAMHDPRIPDLTPEQVTEWLLVELGPALAGYPPIPALDPSRTGVGCTQYACSEMLRALNVTSSSGFLVVPTVCS